MKSNDNRPVNVVLIGLGKLGLTVANGLGARSEIRIVGAVDLDPGKAGVDLGGLTGGAPTGVEVSPELADDAWSADVAVVMTSSRIVELVDLVSRLLEKGIDVVTSAEEMAYPWREFPEESRRLDEIARRHGSTLVGAGANPGFLMDVVPVVLSCATQDVRHLQVTRAIDLRPHRETRLRRFALGQEADRFEQLFADGVAHGHIGFRQSIDAFADALNLPIDRVEELPLRPTVIATGPRSGDLVTLEPGTIAVVTQGARALVGDEEVVRLEEHFGFHDEDDEIPRGDTYVLTGEDQQFTVAVRPGVMSFVTTPAVLINMIVPVSLAAPGWRSTIDFPVRDLASKGRGRAVAVNAAAGP